MIGTGIWSGQLRYLDQAAAADAAAELDSLGFTALWIPDVGGDLFDVLRNLLGATSRCHIATGILNIWMHEPEATTAAYHELVAEHGPRLLIGLGVSHAPLIDLAEAGRYQKPLAKMVSYLDGLDASDSPVPRSARVLAALGPKMLELARTRAAGAHPYLVTADHTRIARQALGPEPLLAPEQAVVFSADPTEARELGRSHVATYTGLPNYANNWLRHGMTEADLEHGGSDRLVDALVAWGDDDTIAARLQDHRDAGADHVCVQVVTSDFSRFPLEEWRRVAEIVAG